MNTTTTIDAGLDANIAHDEPIKHNAANNHIGAPVASPVSSSSSSSPMRSVSIAFNNDADDFNTIAANNTINNTNADFIDFHDGDCWQRHNSTLGRGATPISKHTADSIGKTSNMIISSKNVGRSSSLLADWRCNVNDIKSTAAPDNKHRGSVASRRSSSFFSGGVSSKHASSKTRRIVRKFQQLDELANTPAPDVKIGQRVAYKEYYGNEFGTIRWIGRVPQISTDWTVGVEFDNAIGEGDGSLGGRRYFIAKDCFAKFLPLSSVNIVEQHIGRPEPGTMISVMSAAVRPGQMISIQRVSTVHVQHCFLNAPHRILGADILAVNTRLHCQCPNCGPCAHVIKPPRTQRLAGSTKNATHMCQFSTYTCCGMESQEETLCTYTGNKVSSVQPPEHLRPTNDGIPPIGNSWMQGSGYLSSLQAQQRKLMPEEYKIGAAPEDIENAHMRRRLSRGSSRRGSTKTQNGKQQQQQQQQQHYQEQRYDDDRYRRDASSSPVTQNFDQDSPREKKSSHRDSIENRYLFPEDDIDDMDDAEHEPVDSAFEADLEYLSEARYGTLKRPPHGHDMASKAHSRRSNHHSTKTLLDSLRSLISCLKIKSGSNSDMFDDDDDTTRAKSPPHNHYYTRPNLVNLQHHEEYEEHLYAVSSEAQNKSLPALGPSDHHSERSSQSPERDFCAHSGCACGNSEPPPIIKEVTQRHQSNLSDHGFSSSSQNSMNYPKLTSCPSDEFEQLKKKNQIYRNIIAKLVDADVLSNDELHNVRSSLDDEINLNNNSQNGFTDKIVDDILRKALSAHKIPANCKVKSSVNDSTSSTSDLITLSSHESFCGNSANARRSCSPCGSLSEPRSRSAVRSQSRRHTSATLQGEAPHSLSCDNSKMHKPNAQNSIELKLTLSINSNDKVAHITSIEHNHSSQSVTTDSEHRGSEANIML